MTGARRELEHALSDIDGIDDLLAGADDQAIALALAVARVMQQRLADYLRDAERGRRVLIASKEGHRAVHGTPGQRQARYARYQASVDALHRRNPRLSWTQLSDRVGQLHGCTGRSVRRHAANPKKSDTARHCPETAGVDLPATTGDSNGKIY